MIRLIFSDMDGTLLDENGRLPEEFGDVCTVAGGDDLRRGERDDGGGSRRAGAVR